MSFLALAWSWRRILTWDRCVGAEARLVIIARVACVVMMRFVVTLLVLKLTFVLLWVLVSLLRGACSLARAPSMAWTPCHRDQGESCHPASCRICCRCHDNRCYRDPATWSCDDGTCRSACCDDCHLRNLVPSHGGPSHRTACEVRDASRISRLVWSDVRVSLPGSHLLPTNWRCSWSTLRVTQASHC